MNRRNYIQTGLLLASASFLTVAVAQTAAAVASPVASAQKRYKMVIQVSDKDPATWNLALNNAKNLQEDVGAANVDVEIVVYGPGIGMVKLDSLNGSRVADAIKANVNVVVCENTMRAQKLTTSDLLPAMSYVPAGATEVMKKQSEGWAYLRP